MFVFDTKHHHHTHYVYDVATLHDILVGLFDDEDEAKRITAIAGHMRLGDTYSNKEIYLKCKSEEDCR